MKNFTIKILLRKCIRLYQSLPRKPRCRYYPSCSQFLLLALKKYSLLKALRLGFLRILSCHPYCKGGIHYP
jgi:putative membrane protein insertion efficiency factor